MAKTDEVSAFERHVEKGVLAFCILLLLYAVNHWVLSSPTRLEVPSAFSNGVTEQVPPDQFDEKLKQVAQAVQRRNENAPVPVFQNPQAPRRIKELRKGPEGVTRLVSMCPERQAIKLSEGADQGNLLITVRLAQLQSLVPAPSRCYVRIERELPFTGSNKLADRDISRAVVVYPLDELRQAWRNALRNQKYLYDRDFVFMGVQVQRREIGLGQKWWDVTPEQIKPLRLPIYLDNNPDPTDIPTIPVYTGKNKDEVRLAINDYQLLQEDILQPKYWQIWKAEQWVNWRVNLPMEPLRDEMQVEPTELTPAGPTTGRRGRMSRGSRTVRPGLMDSRMGGRRGREEFDMGGRGRDEMGPPSRSAPPAGRRESPNIRRDTGSRSTRERSPSGRSGRDSGRSARSGRSGRDSGRSARSSRSGRDSGRSARSSRSGRDFGRTARSGRSGRDFGRTARSSRSGRDSGRTARSSRSGRDSGRSGRSRPTRSPRDMEGFESRGRRGMDAMPSRRQERPGRLQPRGTTPLDQQEAPLEVEKNYEVPHFLDQMASGKVLVWIHDRTIKPMKSYQYRIRLKLLNPLLTHDDDLVEANRADGMQVAILTPWSPWSNVKRMDRGMRFFMTGSVGRTSHSEGKVRVTVFAKKLGQRVRHEFTLSPGQVIGRTVEKEVRNPLAQGDNQLEPFVKVPVDFATGATLVDIDFNNRILTGGISRRSVAMIYLDETGSLQTCSAVQRMSDKSDTSMEYHRLLMESEPPGSETAVSSRR